MSKFCRVSAVLGMLVSVPRSRPSPPPRPKPPPSRATTLLRSGRPEEGKSITRRQGDKGMKGDKGADKAPRREKAPRGPEVVFPSPGLAEPGGHCSWAGPYASARAEGGHATA